MTSLLAKLLNRRILKDGVVELRPLLKQELLPQVGDHGTPVVIHDWNLRDKTQLHLVTIDDVTPEEVPECKCCGSSMTKITQVENVFGATSVESSVCPECEFIQHTRGYSPQWMYEHFRDHWIQTRPIKGVKANDNIMKRVRDVLPAGATILDVGCGNGDKMIPFQQQGHECYGVEPCSREVDLARQCFSADRIIHASAEGFLADPCVPQADLVYFSGVLAFIRDPFTVMRQVLEKVKPGGFLFVLEPNYSSVNWNVFYNSHMVICPSFFSPKCFGEFARQNDLSIQIRSIAPLGVLFRKGGDIAGPRSQIGDVSVNLETIYDAIDGQLNFDQIDEQRLLEVQYRKFGMSAQIGTAIQSRCTDRPVADRFPIRFIHQSATPPVLLK